MSNAIRTYQDLENERKRLEDVVAYHKEQIRINIEGIREDLRPITKAVTFVRNFTHPDNSNPLFKTAANLLVDGVIKNLVLARAGWLTKLLAQPVLKNLSHSLLARYGSGLLKKIIAKMQPRDVPPAPEQHDQ